MTHLEFLALFGSFTNGGQENVSNSQAQQIHKTLATSVTMTDEQTDKISDNLK